MMVVRSSTYATPAPSGAQNALLSGVEDRVDGVGAEVELPPELT